mgnify:CR=1 FL=1
MLIYAAIGVSVLLVLAMFADATFTHIITGARTPKRSDWHRAVIVQTETPSMVMYLLRNPKITSAWTAEVNIKRKKWR